MSYIWSQDLTETVFHFATKTLAEKGTFLCKMWDGRGTQGKDP